MKPNLVKPGVVGRVEVSATPGLPTIRFGGIHLTADGVTFHGKPDFGDYENAMRCAVYLEDKAPFWKADLLEYGHKRIDWAGFLDAVVDAGTFTKSTISQYRYVARAVPAERRVEGLSFSHHEAVASLPGSDQRGYLERAKRDHLSVSALKQVVRKSKAVRRILKGQASELANAQDAVTIAAHDAAAACKEIAADDCKHAEKKLGAARRLLDTCELAVKTLRKAQGK